MRSDSMGRRLYREPFGPEYLQIALTIIVVSIAFAWIGAILGPYAWPFYLLIIPAFLIPVLFLLLRKRSSAVFEGGVAVSVSLSEELIRKKKRKFHVREIKSIWPIIGVSRAGDRYLRAYEVATAEGPSGQIRIGHHADSRDTRQALLDEALRKMEGAQWPMVCKPIPDVDGRLVTEISGTMQQPARSLSGGVSIPFVAMITGLVLVYSIRISLEIGPSYLAAPVFVVGLSLFVFGFYGLRKDMNGTRKRLETLWLYVQITDYEKESGRHLLPGIAVHPDYTRWMPGLTVMTADPQQLISDLKSQGLPMAGIIGVSLILPFLLVGVVFGMHAFNEVGYLLVVAGMLSFALFMMVAMGKLRRATDAAAKIRALVLEEWRTGKQVLPREFGIPKSFNLFRTPPELSAADIARMRRSRLIADSDRLLLAIPILLVIVIMPILLGMKGPLAFALIMTPLIVFMGFMFWSARGIRLLRSLREYEDVSGRQVLPSELSVRFRSGKP